MVLYLGTPALRQNVPAYAPSCIGTYRTGEILRNAYSHMYHMYSSQGRGDLACQGEFCSSARPPTESGHPTVQTGCLDICRGQTADKSEMSTNTTRQVYYLVCTWWHHSRAYRCGYIATNSWSCCAQRWTIHTHTVRKLSMALARLLSVTSRASKLWSIRSQMTPLLAIKMSAHRSRVLH